MHNFAQNYYQYLIQMMNAIEVTDHAGTSTSFFQGIELTATTLLKLSQAQRKMMAIGNGASASISSHIAADFSKNGGIRAMAFNDIALVTAVSNDLGYQHVFEKPISMFAETGDVLIAISSSGQSENILRGVQAARSQGCQVITLSGFHPENPLRTSGDLNFYVPAQEYGPVEVVHHSICHCILDSIIKRNHE